MKSPYQKRRLKWWGLITEITIAVNNTLSKIKTKQYESNLGRLSAEAPQHLGRWGEIHHVFPLPSIDTSLGIWTTPAVTPAGWFPWKSQVRTTPIRWFLLEGMYAKLPGQSVYFQIPKSKRIPLNFILYKGFDLCLASCSLRTLFIMVTFQQEAFITKGDLLPYERFFLKVNLNLCEESWPVLSLK